MALAEAALLSKESAVTLGALLVLRCALLADPRERWRALRLGVLPIVVMTSGHLLILRPLVLQGLGRTLASGFGFAWLKNACGLAAATIVPLEVERLSYRPVSWGAVAVAAWLLLLVSGIRAGRGLPRAVPVALCAFAILVGPHIVGFQERYLFLPVAASSLAIAAIVSAAGPVLGRSLLLAIISTWIIVAAGHWHAWWDASLASEHLLDRLVEETELSHVEEIVIANVPFRVRGASVAGDFQSALGVLGARPVPVKAATWVSYPSVGAVAMAEPPEWTVDESDPANVAEVTVRLEVRGGPFLHYVGPGLSTDHSPLRTSVGELSQEGPDLARVTLRTARGRTLFVWDRGHLIPLIERGATAPDAVLPYPFGLSITPSPVLPLMATEIGLSSRMCRTKPVSSTAGCAASQSQSMKPSPASGLMVK
jgi:hypothetical protein